MASIQRFLVTVILLSLAVPAEAQFLKKLRRAVDDAIVTPNERNPSCSYLTLTETGGVLFSEDFESGQLGTMWAARPGEEDGFVDVVDRLPDVQNLPYDGDYALAMGKQSDSRAAVVNAVDLCLDLSNQGDATLHFYIRDQSDETSENDAILLSDDGGETFELALRLQPTSWGDMSYGMVTVDLTAAARQIGLKLTDRFVIRLQQEGNSDFVSDQSFAHRYRDGFFLDKVVLMGSPVYARPPFQDGFESGGLGLSWRVADAFRRGETAPELNAQWGLIQPVQRLSDVPPIPRSGDFSLAMGRPAGTDGRTRLVNAVDLHLNLEGKEQASLRFYLRHESDEPDEFDALFLSDDGGEHFKRASDFQFSEWPAGEYHQVVLDLKTMASELGLILSNKFVIRLQQEGNSDFVSNQSFAHRYKDGFFIDDLVVDAPLSPKEEATARLETALEGWRQRGRYEKTENYEARLKNGEEAARDSLAQVVLTDIVASRIDLSAVQTAYDPDTEIFTLTIDHLEPFKLAVPISEAEAFDQNLAALQYQNPVYSFGSGDALEIVSAEVTNPANGNTYKLTPQR